MKTAITIRFSILLFGILALSTSCKNPNATQETDGNEQVGLTPAEIDSSATDTSAKTTTTTKTDLEGSDSTNN